RHDVEQTHPLDRAGRGVDPGVILTGAVVNRVPHAQPKLPASASAGPAVMPDVAHVGRVVARRDVSMRRREYSQATRIQLGGDGPVSDIRRPPVRAGGHLGVKLALGIVVGDRGDYFTAPR